MKKNLFVLLVLTLTASAFAQESVKVNVTGDRVSLRAAPETNAVLLTRAKTGDELILKENSTLEWVGVIPPDAVDLWVSSEFVSNKTVRTELLNIRSGPSLSHSIVGTASSGTVLNVRGEIAQWLKIAPTSNTVVWLSRKYVDAPAPVIVEPVAAPVSVQPAKPVVQIVAEPTVQEIMTAVSAAAKKKLVEDPSKPRGAEGTFSGILQPVDPMLYKLTDDHFTDVIVCYIRGNTPQMKTFTGLKIEITGKTYWAAGMDLPVLVPSRIRLMPAPVKK